MSPVKQNHAVNPLTTRHSTKEPANQAKFRRNNKLVLGSLSFRVRQLQYCGLSCAPRELQFLSGQSLRPPHLLSCSSCSSAWASLDSRAAISIFCRARAPASSSPRRPRSSWICRSSCCLPLSALAEKLRSADSSVVRDSTCSRRGDRTLVATHGSSWGELSQ